MTPRAIPKAGPTRAYLSRPSRFTRVKGWVARLHPTNPLWYIPAVLFGCVVGVILGVLTSCAPGLVSPPGETCEIPVDSTRGGGLLDSLGQYDSVGTTNNCEGSK